MHILRTIINHYLAFRPFNEPEAWALFKIAAIAEAVGWTLLIVGIFSRDVLLLGHAPVAVAGRIHGMLFVAYIVAVLALSPSLGWSIFRTLVAGLCSVPPYGSLVYEQISAFFRKRSHFKRLRNMVSYKLATDRTVV